MAKKSHKKIIIQNLIFLGIFIALLVVYFFIVKPSEKRKHEWGKIDLLEGVRKSEIIGLEIAFLSEGNYQRTILNKVSNKWQMVYPITIEAHQVEVDKTLDDLIALKSENILTNLTPDKLTEYGFDKPSSIIKIGLQDGRVIEIVNGGLGVTENMYYTMLNNDSNTIYLVYAYKFSTSERKPDMLIERNIFDQRVTEVVEFQIQSEDGKIYNFKKEIQNEEPIWEMVSPVKMVVDDYRIKMKIMEYFALQMSGFAFYERTPQLINQYSLNKPKYSIRSIAKDGSVNELYISAKMNPPYYYAYSPQKPGIIWIDEADISTKFQLTVDEFKQIAPTNSGLVTNQEEKALSN